MAQIRGENVVGVAEGSGKGPLLLVGADYDTSLHHHPLEDNGAGVAALLEVARNYMAATGPQGDFTRSSTVIFVAFDLNTKEYVSVCVVVLLSSFFLFFLFLMFFVLFFFYYFWSFLCVFLFTCLF